MDPAQIDRTLAPTAALSRLVLATRGRAAPELVALLAFDLVGPWASARVGRRDWQATATGPDDLFSLVGQFQAGPRLPEDRGPLAFLRHYRLALPVAELGRVPAWLQDPALAAAWVPLAPTGWPDDPDDTAGLVRHDSRLVAIQHLIACSADPDGTVGDNAARFAWTLTSWCLGPDRAVWSEASGSECRARRAEWSWDGPKRWWNHAPLADAGAVTVALADPGLIGPDWTPPPPSPAELAGHAERERVLAVGRAEAEAWRNRPRSVGRPAELTNTYVQGRLAQQQRQNA